MEIDASQVDRKARQFLEAQNRHRGRQLRAMRQIGKLLVDANRDEAPRGVSPWPQSVQNSIGFRVFPEGEDGIRLEIRTNTRGVYVATGTRPHWPPPGALTEWVRVKWGITDEKKLKSADFLARRAIAIFGTPVNDFHVRALRKVRPEIDRIAQEQFGAALVAELR